MVYKKWGTVIKLIARLKNSSYFYHAKLIFDCRLWVWYISYIWDLNLPFPLHCSLDLFVSFGVSQAKLKYRSKTLEYFTINVLKVETGLIQASRMCVNHYQLWYLYTSSSKIRLYDTIECHVVMNWSDMRSIICWVKKDIHFTMTVNFLSRTFHSLVCNNSIILYSSNYTSISGHDCDDSVSIWKPNENISFLINWRHKDGRR